MAGSTGRNSSSNRATNVTHNLAISQPISRFCTDTLNTHTPKHQNDVPGCYVGDIQSISDDFLHSKGNLNFDNLDFHFLTFGNYAPLESMLVEGDREAADFFNYF